MSGQPLGTVEQFRSDLVRSSRLGTLIGAIAGLGAVVLFGALVVAITLALGPRRLDTGEVVRAALQAIVIIGLGALLGRIVAAIPASFRLRDLAGGRTEARRLARVIFNRTTPDSETEAALTRRYAPYIAVLLRQQAPTLAGFYALIVANIVLQTFNGSPGVTWLRIFQIVLVAALVIFAFIAFPLLIRRIRQAETYADRPSGG